MRARQGGLQVPGIFEAAENIIAGDGIAVAGGLWPRDQMLVDPTSGLIIAGVAGAGSDLFFCNAAGSAVARVPTGTVDMDFLGNVGLAAGKVVEVGGTQVVGGQGAAVADATDPASAVMQLNALLARCRAHGLIAS